MDFTDVTLVCKDANQKLIQKKIHVIGTLKVASMPQREMVDQPSSALDEIQLRTQRLQNKLYQAESHKKPLLSLKCH